MARVQDASFLSVGPSYQLSSPADWATAELNRPEISLLFFSLPGLEDMEDFVDFRIIYITSTEHKVLGKQKQ